MFTFSIYNFFFFVKYYNDKSIQIKLMAQIRNISNSENKCNEDLIKALSEPKHETLKPESPKPETLKPEIPKQTLKPETSKTTPETKPKTTPKQKLKPETKLELKFNRKKLNKLRKDFDELKHKFFNKNEISEYRKAFLTLKSTNFLNQKLKRQAKILINFKKS